MGLDTPDSWVEVWRTGPAHAQYAHTFSYCGLCSTQHSSRQHRYAALMLEICNEKSGGDWIGGRTLERRYIYTAQAEWVHNPRWVLLAETLEADLRVFCSRIGLEYAGALLRTAYCPSLYYPSHIIARFRYAPALGTQSERLNHTKREAASLPPVSQRSAAWLRGVYHADVALYEAFRTLSREERIPCVVVV
jgi:hypothetical protein